jgi:hypothetical protein
MRKLLTDEELMQLLIASSKREGVFPKVLQDLVLTGERLSEVALRHPETSIHGFGLWLSNLALSTIGRSIVPHDIRKKVYWWALNPYYERYIDESDVPLKWGDRAVADGLTKSGGE